MSNETTNTMGLIPESVKAAAERSRELIEEARKEREAAFATPAEGEENGVPAGATSDTSGELPAEGEETAVAPVETPLATVEEKDLTQAAPVQAESRDATYWENRFRTNDGISRARIRELELANAELTGQVRTLLDQLAQRPTAPAPTAPQAAAFNPAEYEDMGPEVHTLAQELAATKAKQDEQERKLAEMGGAVAQTEAERVAAARARAKAHLDAEVPDWLDVDRDPGFLAYLQKYNLYDYFQGRLGALDAVAVAKVFKDYKGEAGLTMPAAPYHKQEPAPSAAPVRTPPIDADPPSRSSAGPVEAPKGKTYTRADIEENYRKIREGKLTAAEALALKKDMILAGREGRVR